MFRSLRGTLAARAAVIAPTTIFPLLVATGLGMSCGQGLQSPGSATSAHDAGAMDRMSMSIDQKQSESAVSANGMDVDGNRTGGTNNDAPDDMNRPNTHSQEFSPAVGGTFDFGAGSLTVSSNTFDGRYTLSASTVLAPRPGPVSAVHAIEVSPHMSSRTPARIRLRLPNDWSDLTPTTWQLAYFKHKPTDPPGLWISCQDTKWFADDRAIEGEAPSFADGIEEFALLRRCSTGVRCDLPLVCISGLCQ